jgi:hypothetical protein
VKVVTGAGNNFVRHRKTAKELPPRRTMTHGRSILGQPASVIWQGVQLHRKPCRRAPARPTAPSFTAALEPRPMSRHAHFFGHATDGTLCANARRRRSPRPADMHPAAVDVLLGDLRSWHDR